jgi:KUP system potassium uptake protein
VAAWLSWRGCDAARQGGPGSWRWLACWVSSRRALFYGDSMITPAISVLSAVEGLEVAAPQLHYAVVPLTMAIVVVLFMIQRHGSARIGVLFGPVMTMWFTTLAVLGIQNIA